MTDNDFRVETRQPAKKKPNYTLRRYKLLAAIILFACTTTLLLTWERPASTPWLWLVAGIYLLTGTWLVVRFAPKDVSGDDTSATTRGGGTANRPR